MICLRGKWPRGAWSCRFQHWDPNSREDENQSPPPAHFLELAEKERNHQGCLEGPDAAAGFIDAEKSGLNLNEITVLQRWNTKQMQSFNGHRRGRLHQILSNQQLKVGGPRDGDKNEANTERKVSEPRLSAEEIDGA